MITLAIPSTTVELPPENFPPVDGDPPGTLLVRRHDKNIESFSFLEISFTSVFFFLNIFRCRGRRKICLLWDCLQLNYLPHRTSRSIDGNRRRKRELLVRNSLDASCCRSFRSRRLYWSLPNHSDSFSHLHTRMFLLQLQVIILIDLKTKQ